MYIQLPFVYEFIPPAGSKSMTAHDDVRQIDDDTLKSHAVQFESSHDLIHSPAQFREDAFNAEKTESIS